MSKIDVLGCVVVGYNDIEFNSRAIQAKELESASGAYEDLKANSVIFESRRITYMDLLNRSLFDVTGSDPELNVFRAPNLAVYYLTAFLRRHGFAVEYVNSFKHDREYFRQLLSTGPRAVAITTTFYVDHYPVREIVDFVRAHAPGTKIIVGGPFIFNLCEDHDPISQDYIFRQLIGADIYIHDAQGEATLLDALRMLRDHAGESLEQIPNLIYDNRRESYSRTARKPENNSLNDNTVAWNAFAQNGHESMITVRTARSCPFSCSFCNYPTLAGAHTLTGLEELEQELRSAAESGARYINFIDDTFNVPLPRFKELMKMMIRNRFPFRWVSFFRCSNADDEAFDLMRQAGCAAVFLGIESGDARILENMNKKANPKRYLTGIERLHSYGIETWASVIVGFPGETADSVRATIDLLETAHPTYFTAQLYYHDRRSPIHQRATEFGIKGAGYSWSHETMDWRAASEWLRIMYSSVVNSTPFPVDGFSVWALPYLLANGIATSTVLRFGKAARRLLTDSFQERGATSHDPVYQGLLSELGKLRDVHAMVTGHSARYKG
jgi:radical SAM PhpK family P-methyltransferase